MKISPADYSHQIARKTRIFLGIFIFQKKFSFTCGFFLSPCRVLIWRGLLLFSVIEVKISSIIRNTIKPWLNIFHVFRSFETGPQKRGNWWLLDTILKGNEIFDKSSFNQGLPDSILGLKLLNLSQNYQIFDLKNLEHCKVRSSENSEIYNFVRKIT